MTVNVEKILNQLTREDTIELAEATLNTMPNEDVIQLVLKWAKENEMVDELMAQLEG